MTTTRTTYSAEQLTYMAARAAFDVQMAAYSARSAALDWSDFDAANDRDEEIRTELQIGPLGDALNVAEEAVLEWALAASLRCKAARSASATAP